MNEKASPVVVVGPLPRQQNILLSKLGRPLAARLRFLNHQHGRLNVPASCRFAVAWVDFISHMHLNCLVSQVGRAQVVQYSGGLKGLTNELRKLLMAV